MLDHFHSHPISLYTLWRKPVKFHPQRMDALRESVALGNVPDDALNAGVE